MRAIDCAAGALLAAAGFATIFVFIPMTVDDPGLDDLPPAFMPEIAAILMTALAVLLALRGLRRREATEEPALDRRHAKFVFLAMLWLAAAFAAVALASYLVGGAVAIVGAMLLMRIRRPLVIGGVACAAPLVLWAVFWQVLTIPLP
ncbi:MAG: tripartite tricarboxylate transporter TctB family protein [Defluviicoccus sp.]|nr:tripartite tricarboxylate transporter TctB family protein [Defluviicoccus sp.]